MIVMLLFGLFGHSNGDGGGGELPPLNTPAPLRLPPSHRSHAAYRLEVRRWRIWKHSAGPCGAFRAHVSEADHMSRPDLVLWVQDAERLAGKAPATLRVALHRLETVVAGSAAAMDASRFEDDLGAMQRTCMELGA